MDLADCCPYSKELHIIKSVFAFFFFFFISVCIFSNPGLGPLFSGATYQCSYEGNVRPVEGFYHNAARVHPETDEDGANDAAYNAARDDIRDQLVVREKRRIHWESRWCSWRSSGRRTRRCPRRVVLPGGYGGAKEPVHDVGSGRTKRRFADPSSGRGRREERRLALPAGGRFGGTMGIEVVAAHGAMVGKTRLLTRGLAAP
jgi:hypothetical protein